jgi:hypothetical protein
MITKQKFNRLTKQVICVLLMPVTITLVSEFAFAENINIKATEVDRAETTKVDNKSLNASLVTKLAAEQSSWVLTADQWEIARNGESILSLVVLNDLVNTWLSEVESLQSDAQKRAQKSTQSHKNEIIEIQYPGGEEGEFWVQELVDWLVALGLPSRFMLLTPGSVADEIKFHLNRR